MAEERLHCEIGDHIWIADLKPGEPKPTVCTYHAKQQAAPPKPPTRAKSKGKNDPKLDAKTGVPIPTEHVVPRIGTTSKPTTGRKLYCQAGQHEWVQDPPKKGKPPKNCPEHQPQPQKAAEGSSEGHKARVRGGRPDFLTLAEIRERYPRVDNESARIFAYYEREVSRSDWPGWREQGDISLLVQGYNNRLRMIARQHGSVPAEIEAV